MARGRDVDKERRPTPARVGRRDDRYGGRLASEELLDSCTGHPRDAWGAAARADTMTKASTAMSLQARAGNAAVRRLVGAGSAADVADGINSSAGRGIPLDGELRLALQHHLGADLGAVRLHLDPTADRLAESVGARAFTRGNDIYFRSGAYEPNTPDGLRTLAHEATHVVQQAVGPVEGRDVGHGGLSLSTRNDRFETAAHEAGNAILQGRPARQREPAAAPGNAGRPKATIQREEPPKEETPPPTYNVTPSLDLTKGAGQLDASGQYAGFDARLRAGYQLQRPPLLDAYVKGNLGGVDLGGSYSTETGGGAGAIGAFGDLKAGGNVLYDPSKGLGAGAGVSYATPGFQAGGGLTMPPGGSPTLGGSVLWNQGSFQLGGRGSLGPGGAGAGLHGQYQLPNSELYPAGTSLYGGANLGTGGAMPGLGPMFPGSSMGLPQGPFVPGAQYGQGGYAGVSVPVAPGVKVLAGTQNITPQAPLGTGTLGLEGTF